MRRRRSGLGALAEAWGAEPHIYSQEDTERALGTSCANERLVQMGGIRKR